ncbi:hypothetical protein BCR33DRAFT_81413 [Rhizoclosmatium globosum]|uniref:Uncharacterized protein n=1 Tax=Rhizoclosmatium globosum TaxID=329046 RepID=A0A1Y2CLL4_9FUNG|nr:hypothetical protein BCR33DRAFT_81413 [Rhizoclosmatium globosum]|eukprot:ORY47918.1 hypothetical protein BCR33DRAFT_81413 [Rhizoclosmatium globosum]
MDAIHECTSAAWRVVHLASLTALLKANTSLLPLSQTENIRKPPLLSVFESFIALWFVACRMDVMWLQLVEMDSLVYLVKVRDALQMVMKEVRMRRLSTPIIPLVNAMEAMFAEVEDVVMFGRSLDNVMVRRDEASIVLEVELGMETMRLGNGHKEMIDPWCYMGFLGLEMGVRKDMRWKGRMEESWRLFWKLYS